jgi:hypothetical protein
MTEMGPEALLLMPTHARQRDLAEYARLEYAREESARIEATLLGDFESLPTQRSGVRRLFRLGRRLSPGDAGAATAARGVRAGESDALAAKGTSLAALPATQYLAQRGSDTPLSALPLSQRI